MLLRTQYELARLGGIRLSQVILPKIAAKSIATVRSIGAIVHSAHV